MRLGIDFDNTIASYDELFGRLARECGLLDGDVPAGKTAVRDAVRRGPAGEAGWQRLQALAYGHRVGEAVPFDGVAGVLAACRRAGLDLCIVSHKTRRAASEPDGPDLRQAALDWMAACGLFGPATGLSAARVTFCDTRAEKLAVIRRLGCTHFIDDLPELFREPAFPAGVCRLLFDPAELAPAGPWRRFSRWQDIGGFLLAHAAA